MDPFFRKAGYSPSFGAVRAWSVVLAALSLAVLVYGLFVTFRPRPPAVVSSSRRGDPIEAFLIIAALVLALAAICLFKRINAARILVVLLLSLASVLSDFWFGLTLLVALSGWGPRTALLSQLFAPLAFHFGVFLVAGSGALFLSSPGVRRHFNSRAA